MSFPALLFALAIPRSRFDPEPAIERVIAGAPLSELAAAADLPMWTRKLMPEAFLHAIPPLPDGEIFRRQIANHLPRRPKEAFPWLLAVSRAFVWGNEQVALWIARYVFSPGEAEAVRHWRLLCLWAWHASHPEAPAGRCLSPRWSPDMLPHNALEYARDWLRTAMTLAEMGDVRIADAWGRPTAVEGFAFEPVRTAEELIAQAGVFNNCVRAYAEDLADNTGRLWVISRDGKPVGMLHLHAGEADCYPKLGEISGAAGGSVGAEAIRAAHLWFRQHVPMAAVHHPPRRDMTSTGWRRIWRDYWLDKQRLPGWLPLRYSWHARRGLVDADWRARRRRR